MKGLYFHIPFCRSKCPYCDFYSRLPDDAMLDAYTDALCDEMSTGARTAAFCENADLSFDTVYFGGGTPSVLGGERLLRILNEARQSYRIAENAEITVECNPSGVDEEFFRQLAHGGVNRISLGLQSAVDAERRQLGRFADKKQVEKALTNAQNSGITNLSLDVMLGIPDQTIASLDETLSFCLSMGVPHISAYMLALEENTVFYRRRDRLNLPDEDAVCELYLHMSETLTKNGIRQYEISNFAKPGFTSRHNLKYWNCEEYLGLGPSAHSFLGGKRFFFPRDTDGFIKGDCAVFDAFGGDAEEYLMLRLRLTDGVRFDDYCERFASPLPDAFLKKARAFAGQGLMTLTDEHIALTRNGFLVSNYILSELL